MFYTRCYVALIIMKIGDKVSFCIDADNYIGIIKRMDENTADVLVFMGLITNIPVNELNTT